MAAPRKPAAELAAKGAFDKNPSRRRVDPPGRGELPAEAPPHLAFDPTLEQVWREVAAAIPAGVATGSDVFAVERLCRLLARSRSGEPWRAADESQLRALLGTLGLTPAARASLGTPPKPPADDPLGEFRPPIAPSRPTTTEAN